MSSLLRRVRGALGNGVAWAAAWVAAQAVFLGVAVATGGSPFGGLMPFVPSILLTSAVTGFLSGVTFSMVFAAVNRRQLLENIRLPSTALVGAAAGALFPGLQLFATATLGATIPVGIVLYSLSIGALMGSGTAVASVQLAKAAHLKASGMGVRSPLDVDVPDLLSGG